MKYNTLENTQTKKTIKPTQKSNHSNENKIAWFIVMVLCLLLIQHIHMHECGILTKL
jgi:uncharacterized membrane protein YvbJ